MSNFGMEYTRISDAAELLDEGWNEEKFYVFVTYRLFGKWDVDLRCVLHDPWTGISELHVVPADYPDEDNENEEVTGQLLRVVPFADARKRIEALRIEAYKADGTIRSFPERFETPLDFATLAAAYVEEIKRGSTQPIQRLSKIHGVSRNTLSARIRRAREDDMGLLTRPTKDSLGELTEKAKVLLQTLSLEQEGSAD